MTQMTIILMVNAAFSAVLIYALVFLLGHGIHADRHHRIAVVERLLTRPAAGFGRLAA